MILVIRGFVLEHAFAALVFDLIKPKFHTIRRADRLPRLFRPIAVHDCSNIVIEHVKARGQCFNSLFILILKLSEMKGMIVYQICSMRVKLREPDLGTGTARIL